MYISTAVYNLILLDLNKSAAERLLLRFRFRSGEVVLMSVSSRGTRSRERSVGICVLFILCALASTFSACVYFLLLINHGRDSEINLDTAHIRIRGIPSGMYRTTRCNNDDDDDHDDDDDGGEPPRKKEICFRQEHKWEELPSLTSRMRWWSERVERGPTPGGASCAGSKQ